MQIQAVLFDLGGVIINLAPENTIREFQKHIPNFTDARFNGKEDQLPLYSDYETGRISSEEFLREFNLHYGSSLSMPVLVHCWNAMVLNFPIERIQFLRQLRAEGKKLFLLSNTNEIHEKIIHVRFREIDAHGKFEGLFDRVYYSHVIGKRKPNADAFLTVVEENKLDLQRTLFIDDSPQHVRGAKKIGLPSIHLEKPTTILDLRELRA